MLALRHLSSTCWMGTAVLLALSTAVPFINAQHDTISGFDCFRSLKGIKDSMFDLVAMYPTLSSYSDIGDTFLKGKDLSDPAVNPNNFPSSLFSDHDFDIYAMKVTASDTDSALSSAEKGKMLIITGVHVRELAPPELAMRFAEKLLEGYGVDSDITWLLERTEVHFIFHVNPDARIIAESSDDPTSFGWRKNLNPGDQADNCKAKEIGVDLNRNYDFRWGVTGAATSSDPCVDNYHGSSANSELETQAVVNYARQLFPASQRKEPNPESMMDVALGEDIMGIFVDVHSYGEWIFHPWGHDLNKDSPDEEALEALLRKIHYYNGYNEWTLYPASGDSTDYAYGVLGVAAFGLEIGTAFKQDCAAFDTTVAVDNIASLLYAAKTATKPFSLLKGPDILSLDVQSFDNEFHVEVVASDNELVDKKSPGYATGAQGVAEVLLYLDVHPDDYQVGDTFWSMTLQPPGIDPGKKSFALDINLPIGIELGGQHTLYAQAKDGGGYLGPVSSAFIVSVDWCTKNTNLMSSDKFSQLAPNAVEPYSYANFCKAVNDWNVANPSDQIFVTGTEDERRHELASFFGHALFGTNDFQAPREYGPCGDNKVVGTAVWCKPCKSGFDLNTLTCDEGLATPGAAYTDPRCIVGSGCGCPSAVADDDGYVPANILFFGRGAMQLTLNTNYKAFNDHVNPSPNFCTDPDLLATSNYAWTSAFYFWMKVSNGSGTPHSAVVNDKDFGASLDIINGAGECPASGSGRSVKKRLNRYCRATKAVGLAPQLTSILSLDGCDGLANRFVECIVDGTCPECVALEAGSCSINPDPHYYTWENERYDFHGGCDHIAIDNEKLQVQIRTRPVADVFAPFINWSTITQIAVVMKTNSGLLDEVFRVHDKGTMLDIHNTLTTTGSPNAHYSTSGGDHIIELGNPPTGDSFIKIREKTTGTYATGLSLQVSGRGEFFRGSVGMCGDWDKGGIRLKGGTSEFVPTGSNYFPLADSWKLSSGDNRLANPPTDPSKVCDASNECGGSNAFPCDSTRRRLQPTPCGRTCADILLEDFRKMCEDDAAFTGTEGWACEPNYIDPLRIERVPRSEVNGAPPPPTLTPPPPTPSDSGNIIGKFYVDYMGMKCGQYCNDEDNLPLPCMGPPPDSSGIPSAIWDTAEDCCAAKLFWIDLGTCVANTNGVPLQAEGSTDWYVDWTLNFGTCVQDCLVGPNEPTCGGLRENWEPAFATAEDCCASIPWQPSNSCHL